MIRIVPNGVAVTIKTTFSRQTAVSINIHADKDIIWALLINGQDYPKWNSTINSISGNISKGEKIKLKSTFDAKRVFKISIKEVEPENYMVWGNAMGKRTFSLKAITSGLTNFSMKEKIGGPMFPLFAKMIPPFDKTFERFARDLKHEAEAFKKIQQ
jgi:hypothetical protein